MIKRQASAPLVTGPATSVEIEGNTECIAWRLCLPSPRGRTFLPEHFELVVEELSLVRHFTRGSLNSRICDTAEAPLNAAGSTATRPFAAQHPSWHRTTLADLWFPP